MKVKVHILIFFAMTLLAFFLFPILARADISVSLSLDRREASTLDSVTLTIRLSGTRDRHVNPIIEGLEPFYVSSGGTSSHVQIIQGNIDASVDYTYFLKPKEQGTFEVGPARVTVDGKTHTSNSATLEVNAPLPASSHNRGPVFLMAQLSTSQAFTEQHVIYTLKLCRQTRVSDLKLELPKVEHLTFKKLGEPSEYQSVFNGRTYQVLEIRYALLPAREGIYDIPPAKMSITVYQPRNRSQRRSTNDPFLGDPFFDDRFFPFSRGESTVVSSESLELEVTALPDQGRPPHFSGLVGQFHITSHLEPTEIPVGDSSTFTVRLKGSGNVARMPDLVMPDLPGTKVYEDQPVVEVRAGESGLVGSKTMKWALVPAREGQYDIPSLSVSYFDPEARQYKVINTPFTQLTVTGSNAQYTDTMPGVPYREIIDAPVKEEVKAIGHDILPIRTSVRELDKGREILVTGLAFWGLLLAPPFMVGLVICVKKRQKKADSDRAIIRARKAVKIFIRSCRKGEPSSVDLVHAVRNYLNDRLGLTLGTLTPKEAYTILTTRGVSSGISRQLRDALQLLENAIYTGRERDVGHLYQQMTAIIKRIDKEIR
jgi:hypothetical protein